MKITGISTFQSAIIAVTFSLFNTVHAQLPPPTDADAGLFPAQNHYSPYAGRAYPTDVFWGDTQLHTGNSLDAGAFGASLLPEDANRFPRGYEVISSTGLKVKLSRPLDFLVVADHSDNMGFFPLLNAGDPKMLADPTGRRWYDMIQAGGQEGVAAAVEIIQALTGNSFPDALYLAPGTTAYRSTWDQTIAAAEKYNEPGGYTALHGYEWTSTENGNNRHRVVIYRDGANKAGMMVPYTTLPPYGSPDERELWKWLQSYEDKTGLLNAISDEGTKTYVNFNYGRWDRLAGNTSFVKGIGDKHLGANFYPKDMTKEEFDYTAGEFPHIHPSLRKAAYEVLVEGRDRREVRREFRLGLAPMTRTIQRFTEARARLRCEK